MRRVALKQTPASADGFPSAPLPEQLRKNGTLAVATSRQLAAKALERMLVPASKVGVNLTPIGATPYPTGTELVEIDGASWLLANALDDPMTLRTRGRQVVPREVREQLVLMLQAGVDPDVLWIAHELPAGTSPKDLHKLPVPFSTKRAAADVTLASRLRATVKAGAMVAGGAAVVPLAALSVLSNLDPLLLGGVASSDGRYVLWVELARWSW